MARINFLELVKEKNPTITITDEQFDIEVEITESFFNEVFSKGCITIVTPAYGTFIALIDYCNINDGYINIKSSAPQNGIYASLTKNGNEFYITITDNV